MHRNARQTMADRICNIAALRGRCGSSNGAEHIAIPEQGTHVTCKWVRALVALYDRGTRAHMALYDWGTRAHMALCDWDTQIRPRLPPTVGGAVLVPTIGGRVVYEPIAEVLGPRDSGGSWNYCSYCLPAGDNMAGASRRPLATHRLPTGT